MLFREEDVDTTIIGETGFSMKASNRVLAKHRPSGIAVISESERSAHVNRVAAIAMLREKVEASKVQVYSSFIAPDGERFDTFQQCEDHINRVAFLKEFTMILAHPQTLYSMAVFVSENLQTFKTIDLEFLKNYKMPVTKASLVIDVPPSPKIK